MAQRPRSDDDLRHGLLARCAPRWTHGTARARARLGLNLGLTALFVGDVTYALYFQDILSLHSAGGIGGLGTVMSSISALVGLGQLMLVSDLLLLGLWRLLWRRPALQFAGSRYAALGFLTLAVAFAWESYSLHKERKTQGMFLRGRSGHLSGVPEPSAFICTIRPAF